MRPRYAVLSTFPPTPCGIATFSEALCDGLDRAGADVSVVQVGGARGSDPRVVAVLPDRAPAPLGALDALQLADVVIVQHEYGLYGGRDGDALLDVLDVIHVPLVVVAHTVLRHPTRHQREVLEAVAGAAGAVVVMTEAGRLRLVDGYDVDPAKVVVIPHGAAAGPDLEPVAAPTPNSILTWGLLGPGKGIEWAIDAVALLGDLAPAVNYRIAGDTHPKVAATNGEAYRELLGRRVTATGLDHAVVFDPGYRDRASLRRLAAAASVVVLPYDSPDQVTSGVLVDAVAAGRPVIATAFPHAVELLASGAGLVVPRRDPRALATAIRRVLTEPGLADTMAAEARRLAPSLDWPVVASRYVALGSALVERGTVAA